jgi:hypothetical protein
LDQRKGFSAQCSFGKLRIDIRRIPATSVLISVDGERVAGDAYASFAHQLASPAGLYNLAALCDTENRTFTVDLLVARGRGTERSFLGGRAYIGRPGVYRFDGLRQINEEIFWGILH